MAIKSLSALTSKISSVLSPSLQISNITNSLSSLISPTITNLLSSATKPAAIDLSALSSSLPKVLNLLSGLTSTSVKPAGTADTLTVLMQTLQPLLQSGSSSVSQSQLLQSLPTVVKSISSLIDSFSAKGQLTDNVSSAITAIKPLLAILSSASTNTDVTQIVSTLNKVLDIAQPIIQIAGTVTSGNADLGDIAKIATQSLMPLLSAINTGDSTIDVAKLQKALPAVVGSVTTLITTLTQADQGNIPETVSGVIKGINPLLKLLADSGTLAADQAETVNTVYNVLNSVKTILDFVNNPSLLTLSSDLNNVIDSLKPVVALLDTKGDVSAFLDNAHVPDLGDLLSFAGSKLNLGSLKTAASGLLPNADQTDLSDLLQGSNSSSSNIDLSSIVPSISGTIQNLLGSNTPKLDFSTLLNFKAADLDHPAQII